MVVRGNIQKFDSKDTKTTKNSIRKKNHGEKEGGASKKREFLWNWKETLYTARFAFAKERGPRGLESWLTPGGEKILIKRSYGSGEGVISWENG